MIETKYPKDYWTLIKGNDAFVHYNQVYGLSKTLVTYCVGPLDEVLDKQNTTDETQPNQQEGGTKLSEVVIPIGNVEKDKTIASGTKVGRPKNVIPIDLIRELAGQGYGFRGIARELEGQGYKVSRMTVQRELQEVLI